jgi:HSP20 family molecular chaperone IbpA
MGFNRIFDKLEDKLKEYEQNMDEEEIPPWVGSKDKRKSDADSDNSGENTENDQSKNLNNSVGAFDLEETDSHIKINVALPGVPENNIELTREDSNLKINIEGSDRVEERTYEYQLPDDADKSSIEADYVNGLLTVTIQRS